MTEYSHDIIGVGSPIVDTLIQVEEAFVQSIPGAKGGMEMVTEEEMADLIRQAGGDLTQAPGGSAGNTIFALARLGRKTALLGTIGQDPNGELYRKAFEDMGGDSGRFKTSETANGCCLSLITPDSERTMRTFLGASAELSPDLISAADFAGVRHAHLEGYLFFNPDLIQKILQSAKAAGCSISLDLASFEVVNATRGVLPGLLKEYVDVLFANEDEARAYFEDDRPYEEMAKALSELTEVAAVKLGKDGALIASGGSCERIAPHIVDQPVDTTGAGDLWASGFLHGWLDGLSLAECGRRGSILGAEVVQVIGAAIPPARWPEIEKAFFSTH